MAKLSFFADNRRPDKYGRLPIRLLISNGASTTTITTGISTSPKYFVGEPTQVLVKSSPQAQEANVILYNIYARYFDAIVDLERKCRLSHMTAAQIRQAAEENERRAAAQDNEDFIAFFKEYGNSRSAAKTRKSYGYAENVLREYTDFRHWRRLTFADINYSTLTDFARWLRNTDRGESTRHMLESYVRAAYKEAEKRHVISRENDPYFDYSIAPVPQHDIETLTAAEIHTLACARLNSINKECARDIAIMSFYLCGVNLLDLYEMDIPKNGEVVYVRHKTIRKNKRAIHVRIESELQAIIDRYQGKDAMLRFKEDYASYETFQRRMNLALKKVSEDIGIDISMAKIRRTWATIAGELECPDYIINKSMGHMDNSVNDRSYRDYKWHLTAKWNRKVIDHVQAQITIPASQQGVVTNNG